MPGSEVLRGQREGEGPDGRSYQCSTEFRPRTGRTILRSPRAPRREGPARDITGPARVMSGGRAASTPFPRIPGNGVPQEGRLSPGSRISRSSSTLRLHSGRWQIGRSEWNSLSHRTLALRGGDRLATSRDGRAPVSFGTASLPPRPVSRRGQCLGRALHPHRERLLPRLVPRPGHALAARPDLLRAVLGIVFFTCQPMPLYGPTVWHVVFLAINAVQIRRLVLERRQLRLTEEQERFGEAAFQGPLAGRTPHPADSRDVPGARGAAGHPPALPAALAQDERVLRDLAFSRLSRTELLNLLTRRFWNSLKRRRPARWWRRRRGDRTGIPGDQRWSSRRLGEGMTYASMRGTSRRRPIDRGGRRPEEFPMDIPPRRRRVWQAAAIGVLILLGLSRVDSSGTAPRSSVIDIPRQPRPPPPRWGRPSDLAAAQPRLRAPVRGEALRVPERPPIRRSWAGCGTSACATPGRIIGGKSYGTHPAVRVYYSPGVIRWLKGGRAGTIPDGEMIIKEQYAAPATRHGARRRRSCGSPWSPGR